MRYNSRGVIENDSCGVIKIANSFEAPPYMTTKVLLEDAFVGYQGNNLYNCNDAPYRTFKIHKQTTVEKMLDLLSKSFKYPRNQMRVWPFVSRSQFTYNHEDTPWRPSMLNLEMQLNRVVFDASENRDPWIVFLELLPPDSDRIELPLFQKPDDVLMFFKMYDPKEKRVHYCGHSYLNVNSNLADIVPLLNKRAGFPLNTELELYEEMMPYVVEKIQHPNLPVSRVS